MSASQGISPVGQLVQDLAIGAAGLGWEAAEGAYTTVSGWLAPIGKAVEPLTGPIGNYGWTATAASAGTIFFGFSLGIDRALSAYDHWKEGEIKEVVTDGAVAVGSLALGTFEVFAIGNWALANGTAAGSNPSPPASPESGEGGE